MEFAELLSIEDPISKVEFSPYASSNSNLLSAVSWNCNFYLLDTKTKQLIYSFITEKPLLSCSFDAFSADTHYVSGLSCQIHR